MDYNLLPQVVADEDGASPAPVDVFLHGLDGSAIQSSAKSFVSFH